MPNKEQKQIRQADAVSGPEEFRQLCFHMSPQEILSFPKALFEQYWHGCFEHVLVKKRGKETFKYGYAQAYVCRMANEKHGYTGKSVGEKTRQTSSRVEGTRRYLQRYWFNSMERWGMYARMHSPLLLQMDTTNALEAYHRDLKMTCSPKDGMVASVESIHKLLERKIATENKALLDMRTKVVAEVKIYPKLARFSFQFQRMIVEELRHAYRLCAECKPAKDIMQLEPVCACKFFRKYFLPCRHMFQLDITSGMGWLTDAIWETFIDACGESGFDVYMKRESVRVAEPVVEGTDREAVRFHSKMELIRNKFWRLMESDDKHAVDRFIQAIGALI